MPNMDEDVLANLLRSQREDSHEFQSELVKSVMAAVQESNSELVKAITNRKADKSPQAWIGTGLVLLGWIATLSYFLGSTTERVGHLESTVQSIQQTTPQTNVMDEKFAELKQRLDEEEKHLDYNDRRLDGNKVSR